MIAAVILAAGESRRMGTQKLLLPFGDSTVIGAVVKAALASRADRVLVVLGADRDAVREEIERVGASGRTGEGRGSDRLGFTVNDSYASGMLSSVQAGFRTLPTDAEAAVVMLGDQPLLPSAVVDAVVAAYREGGRGIVIPVFRGRRGHPVLVDLKYRGEVLGLDPAEGLRQLAHAHPDDVREIEAGGADILRDLDTPKEYSDLKGDRDGLKPDLYRKRRI